MNADNPRDEIATQIQNHSQTITTTLSRLNT